jgi:hypothetical protein
LLRSHAGPADYDFEGTRNIEITTDDEVVSRAEDDAECPSSSDEKKSIVCAETVVHEVPSAKVSAKLYTNSDPEMRMELESAFKRSLIYSVIFSGIVIIIGERILYLPGSGLNAAA